MPFIILKGWFKGKMAEPIDISKLKGIEKLVAQFCDINKDGKLEKTDKFDEISLFNKELTNFRKWNPDKNSIFRDDNIAPRDATRVALPEIYDICEFKSVEKKETKKCGYALSPELTDKMKSELEEVKKVFQKNKAIYEKVAKETGLPAELICALHYREGRGLLTKRIRDGRNLVGKDWAKNAIDTLKCQSYCEKVLPDDVNTQLEFAERYNGLGYRKRGRVSPYVYSGTEKYTGGMYVRDGKFSPNAKDSRPGIAALLKALYGEYPEDNQARI